MTDTTINLTEKQAGLADYIALLKPRVMTLVVFTGFVGLMVAPGSIHPFIGAIAIFAIALATGAAGAINMWYDRDIDAVMRRTQTRPIPQGRISPESALEYGCFLTFTSIFIMGVAVNWVAALVLGLASFFYIFVYTIWLKRRTPQNIVIGGAAGAFPPMIGWAAVTGDVSLESSLLFLLIFLWTPPHFWALALFANTDYQKAKVPMLPAVAGEVETRRQISFYSVLLLICALAPFFIDLAGSVYLVGAGVLSLAFLYFAVRLQLSKVGDMAYAKKLFGYSIFYLFALFSLLMVDSALKAVLDPVLK